MKNDMPNMAKINITRNSSRQILKRAGSDIARANNNVLMPFAPLTRRSTRPTFATRTTRNSVGDTKYFSIMSLSTKPEKKNYTKKISKLIFLFYCQSNLRASFFSRGQMLSFSFFCLFKI